MLSLPVGLQRFQPVARWNTQVRKHPRLILQTELSQGYVLNVGRQSSAPPAGPDQFCFWIGEALDHISTIT